MEEAEQKTNSSLLKAWGGLSQTRKISLLVIIAAFLTAAVLLICYFTSPKMGILFSGLNSDSAAAVIARLDEMGVLYELENGGTEILVDEAQVDELRITLNSDGSLYGNSVGFELFDETSLGISESERELNYLRALQGELQRTIGQIEGVEQARVHLVIPEASVFIRETSPATASIVLDLSPLSKIGSEQIKGIVYLVAGSVENLAPDDVTIIDTQGSILSKSGSYENSSGSFSASSTLEQLEIKESFEKELESRIQGMLERVMGNGTVVAMVTAELDFNSKETTELIYGEPVLRSSSNIEEQQLTDSGGAEGEAGTDSNISEYPSGEELEETSNYARFEKIENYEISETQIHSIQAPGEVTKLSASVIFDDSEGTITDQQMQDLKNLVASALGLSETRGDQVSIVGMDFDTSYLEDTLLSMEEAAEAEKIQTYIRYGVIAAAIIFGLILLRKFAKSVGIYLQNRELQSQLPVAASADLSKEIISKLPPIEEDGQTSKIKDLTSQNPETASYLLKMWLSEDQR